jgi:hypothetical protein
MTAPMLHDVAARKCAERETIRETVGRGVGYAAGT